MARDTVTIVSGLPRSGTSMMMSMLQAGGMPILADNVREADDDNPKGYYEFQRVKQIEQDCSWLEDAKGRAVKMISALLQHLPPAYTYRVIFMQRRIEEILASQRLMLIRRGEPTDAVSDVELAEVFRKHLRQVGRWLDEQPNISVLYVSYQRVLQDPIGEANRLNQFLGSALDVDRMVSAVDTSLYRQRT